MPHCWTKHRGTFRYIEVTPMDRAMEVRSRADARAVAPPLSSVDVITHAHEIALWASGERTASARANRSGSFCRSMRFVGDIVNKVSRIDLLEVWDRRTNWIRLSYRTAIVAFEKIPPRPISFEAHRLWHLKKLPISISPARSRILKPMTTRPSPTSTASDGSIPRPSKLSAFAAARAPVRHGEVLQKIDPTLDLTSFATQDRHRAPES